MEGTRTTPRASSLPPGGCPFWSRPVQDAWNARVLQGAGRVSPDEMPVPQWDEASELQVEQMLSPRALSGGRRERFQTPSSWSYPWRGGMRGLRSEGALPDGDRQGVRSQGELREERRSQGPTPERVMRQTATAPSAASALPTVSCRSNIDLPLRWLWTPSWCT